MDNPISIPLTNGGCFLVDAADAEQVLKHAWFGVTIRWGTSRWLRYVRRSFKIDGKWCQAALHRDLLHPGDDEIVDHISGDGLDNRRKNLRIATHQQNMFNRATSVVRTRTIYKGVNLASANRTKRWRALIKINGTKLFLGYFLTEKEAALAYNNKALALFGEFARLNVLLEEAA